MTRTLKRGGFKGTSTGQQFMDTPTHLAATTDSFTSADVKDSSGIWGTAAAGVVTTFGAAADFTSGWDIITGSPDTLCFSERQPKLAAVSLLSDGGYVFLGVLPGPPARLRLIAAGR